jgi:glycosyltransferase involved in cell wall biosynthesis
VKVVFCIPTWLKPGNGKTPITVKSLEASVPLIDAAGIEHACVFEIGNAYISAARATMTRKALDAKADVIVYLDHDLSWDPQDLVKLIETDGDVVAGTYRFKGELEEYMGTIVTHGNGTPVVRQDGCIRVKTQPAGFLKVTAKGIDRFMSAYPELCYGEKYHQSVDLFNHGAHEGVWWGEDFAFCRRWVTAGGELWNIPNLNITHWDNDKPYHGNFHEYLLRQPGGSKHEVPASAS